MVRFSFSCCLLPFFLGMFSSTLNAQVIEIKNYSTENGLPTNAIKTMYQTSDGFIWFGTAGEGLVRFDGTNSIIYSKEHGLKSDTVEVVFEDAHHRLWFASRNSGLAYLERDSVRYPYKDSLLTTAAISHIYQNKAGVMLISTLGNGLLAVNNGEISQLNKDTALKVDTVYSTWQGDNELWVFTNSGIGLYEEAGNNIRWMNLSEKKAYYGLAEDEKGNAWISSSDGYILIRRDSVQVITEVNGESTGAVSDILPTLQGNVILLTQNLGTILFDGQNYVPANQIERLTSADIVGLFMDRQQRYWLMTRAHGVDLIPNQAILWHKAAEVGLEDIYTIFKDDTGLLWAGGKNGFIQIDNRRSQFFTTFKPISNITVKNIGENPDGGLLLLSGDNRLLSYVPGSGEVAVSSLNQFLPDELLITDFFTSSDKRTWIGTERGLMVIQDGDLRWFTKQDGLPSEYILHIAEDREGNVLVGTAEGIAVFDKTGKFITPDLLYRRLSGSQVRFITTKNNNDYWIGTTQGIYYYSTNTNHLIQYDDEAGFNSLNAQALAFTDDSTLFLGTSAGLNKIVLSEDGELKVFHFRLNTDELPAGIHHKAMAAAGSTIWAGTNKGIFSYTITSEPQFDGPEIHITNISVDYIRNGSDRFDKLLSDQSTGAINASSGLAAAENNLTFIFSGLAYENPQRIFYSHRLIGSTDERWSIPDQSKSASYENLDPGNYQFEVRALNNQGLWSPQTASFSFTVLPPFYKSYWFFGILLLGFTGLIYGIERLRLQWLERNKLRELVEIRTNDLKENLKEREILIQEVHHRTKNNLAVISGLLELQKATIKDEATRQSLVQAQSRIQSIALIHEKLYRNESLSKINFHTYVKELLDVVSNSYNYENKDIAVKLQVDNINMTLDQSIPCGLILNELISNAYEHAFKSLKAGEILISFKEKKELVTLEVSDNGIGFPADYDLGSSSSLGMTLVHTLTNQLEGEIQETSRPGHGASFRITFRKEEQ